MTSDVGPSFCFAACSLQDPVSQSMAHHKATVPAAPDMRLMRNYKLLDNLQASEEEWSGRLVDYTRNLSSEPHIQPYMRRMVVDWMAELCMVVRGDCEVFPLAVNLMDRFLSVEQIYKEQLQGVAAACLLTASKVKQPYPFSSKQLIDFTEGGVSASELLSWELLLLNKLKWNVATVTPIEVMEPILANIELDEHSGKQIRLITIDLINAAMTDMRLCLLPPSLQAGACICAAFGYLFAGYPFLDELRRQLPQWIHADPELVRSYMDMVLSASLSAPSSSAGIPSRPSMPRSASTDSGYNSSICASPSPVI